MVERLALALVMAFALALPAWADGGGRTITVGTLEGGWPPFLVVADGNIDQAHGIMLDVMREVCRTNNYTLKMVASPDKRNRGMLIEGAIDAYAKAKEWVKHPERLLWTGPVVESTDVLIFRRGQAVQFTRLGELKGLSLAVIHGFSYPSLEPYFRSGDIQHFTPTTTLGCLRMVLAGHVDAAVVNRQVAEWVFRNSSVIKREDFEFSQNAIDSAYYRFAVADKPGLDVFREDFNRELIKMKEDGRFEAILNKYR